MCTEFYVVMVKRKDNRIYADLHKCLDQLFLTNEDAQQALSNLDDTIRDSFHVVPLIAMTEEEYRPNDINV